jgi:NADP-dependent 3-hydroxy acid dehydrogenase YdfG
MAGDGFEVFLGARRLERLEALASEVGGKAIPLDVTDPESVEAFAAEVPGCAVPVNNAGGALGLEPVREAESYRGGAGYNAAKHAQRAMPNVDEIVVRPRAKATATEVRRRR